jgi:hypothetical protein
MSIIRAVAPIFLFILFLPARALTLPLSFTFTSSLLDASIGQTVTFSATLTNLNPTSIFLNSDAVNINPPLVSDDTKFFVNTPSLLVSGQSITAPILDVVVPLGTPFGLYPGHFEILGGNTPSDLTTVGSADFMVRVGGARLVSEPTSFFLLLSGVVTLLLGRSRWGR